MKAQAVAMDRGRWGVSAPLRCWRLAGRLRDYRDAGDGPVVMSCGSPEDAKRLADYINRRVRAAGPDGLPFLTPRERQVVNRVKAGEDVRAWEVHHTTLLSLISKQALDCHATTCRLTLRAGGAIPETAP